MTTAFPARTQSSSEEVANALSHGIALLVSLIAVPCLIVFTIRTNTTSAVVGASIFGVSVILAYLSSVIYHALPIGSTKLLFRTLDHISIYLLIAGTYTPFMLGVLSGPWGWTLLGIIWVLAFAGIVFKTLQGAAYSHISTIFYILMGWLVVVAIVPLWMNMSKAGLIWLVSGGLAYTAGTIFYAARNIPYAHLIWHLFVMTGTACHFVAVTFYATP